MKTKTLDCKPTFFWLMLILAAFFLSPEHLKAQVVINEVFTKNQALFPDEDGSHSGFIELFNKGTDAEQLSGYGLSNQSNVPYQWVLGNKVLGAGEYFRIWASGKNKGNSPSEAFTLIPFESNWKYLDNGTDQGTAWQQTSFDDSAWPEGAAMLGYGGSTVYGTVLSWGPSSSQKYRCYYFRNTIEIPNKDLVGNLKITIRIDDGAVVYINGVEVMRKNMPEGEITYMTFANVTVGSSYAQFTEIIPGDLLVNGQNTIAVQVHQSTANSSDLRFDLSAEASGVQPHTNFIIADGMQISLLSPDGLSGDTTQTIHTQNNISLGRFPDGQAWKYLLNPSPGTTNTEPALNKLPHATFNEVMVTNQNVISDEDNEYHAWFELFNYSTEPANLSGYFISNNSLEPDKYQIGQMMIEPNAYKLVWASGKNRQGSTINNIIPAGSAWKYKDDGSNQGTAWTALDFDDAAWAQGAAELGYGDGDETTVINGGPSGNRIPCYYFRRKFNIDNIDLLGQLQLGLLRDDGAVVYINGVEVLRDNMPQGEITFQTWASATVDDINERTYFKFLIDKSMLVNGENIIAVSVHQDRPASSDVSFNLYLNDLGRAFHTNFSLSNGDTLFLSNPELSLISEFEIVQDLLPNMSSGLSPDGYGSAHYYFTATPEASNGQGGVISLPNASALVLNPYEGINWSTINHYKANLHTHTTNSDGNLAAHTVVDYYHAANYDILSITDHNAITYPWTAFSSINPAYENRDPQVLGMLDVEGNELSAAHHTGSYINAVPGNGANLHEAFQTMTNINGLGAFKHPGRYWNINTNYTPSSQYSIEWYQQFYNTYPLLVGMEVYNQGDRYNKDRVLWDELLMRMMPDRPIWGQSNDDMHTTSHLFRNYNYMLMPELTLDAFRQAMNTGASYFVYEPSGNGNPQVPVIDSIIVDKASRLITVYAQNATSIEWISGINGVGAQRSSKVVATGNSFSFNYFTQPYVRAIISNAFGHVLTQPFGFADRAPLEITEILGDTAFCQGTSVATFSVANDPIAESYAWTVPQNAVILSGENTNSITIDITGVVNQGSVSVSASNISGNSNTASISFVINPVYNLIENIDIVCGTSYTFPDNSSVENVMENFSHISMLTSIHGCDSVITTNLNIAAYVLTIEANPFEAGIVTGAGNYTPNTEVLLSASANQGFRFKNYSFDNQIIGENPDMTFLMPTQNTQLTASFEPVFSASFIVLDQNNNSIPDAVITLAGIQKEAGQYVFAELPNGSYTYQIDKTGYYTIEGELEILNEDLSITVNLQLIIFNLIFEVTDGTNHLEGAVIQINEQSLLTNQFGQAAIQLTPGTYNYQVSKDTYFSLQGSIEVVDENISESITLQLITYTAAFSINDGAQAIQGASIEINETIISTDASGQAFITLTPGTYDFSVFKESYLIYEGSIVIENENVTETITLQLITFSVDFVISDGTNPLENATIEVNGQSILTNTQGFAALALVPGNYTAIVSKNNYLPVNHSFVVDNEPLNLNIVLQLNSISQQNFNQITVSPNPFSNILRINKSELITLIRFTDILGRTIMEEKLNGRNELSTEALLPGIYFVTLVTTEGKTLVVKMIKK